MKRWVLFVLSWFSAVVLNAAALMPLPRSVALNNESLLLTGSFYVTTQGPKDERVDRAVTRFLARLAGRSGLTFEQKGGEGPSLSVAWKLKNEGVQRLGEPEAYRLQVTAAGASLDAKTPLGVFRGLETLLQLYEKKEGVSSFAGAVIEDQPRFLWRGLLLDSCRHFMPLETIKRNLDGMAAAKLNVLHWHLSEDQAFRVESKAYPALHEKGSNGSFYTHEQVKEILDYARDRGIRVVPEFDMPGHVTAWLVGHPELGSAPGPYEIETHFGIFDPALDPSREEVYAFLEKLLGEMTALFPDDYFHTGGDEVRGKHWDRNPGIRDFKKAKGFESNEDLQAYFSGRVSKILNKLGKRMVGWDEILHAELPKGTVVQAWRGFDRMKLAAEKGFESILSNGYYLDLSQPSYYHYSKDPLPKDSGLSEKQQALILGGEACMWSELVDEKSVDSRLWPRLLAVAERLWSAPTVTDVQDMYRRMDIVSPQLEELGLLHLRNAEAIYKELLGDKADLALPVLELAEPPEKYRRHHSRKYTTATPLRSLVDAAHPESRPAQRFDAAVTRMLLSGPDFDMAEVRKEMRRWAAAARRAKPVLAGNPKTADAAPLADSLEKMADVGLEALAKFQMRRQASHFWLADAKRRLKKASATHAELELTALASSVRRIAVAAASLNELKKGEVQAWVDEVDKDQD